MPIPSDTAGLAIAVASGVIKLVRRVDDIAAEEKVTQGVLALPQPVDIKPPSALDMLESLRALLDRTDATSAPPEGEARAELAALLASEPDQAELLAAMEAHIPLEIEYHVVDIGGEATRVLEANGAIWNLNDQDTLRIAYFVGGGEDLREGSLGWKLGMTVLDVLAELVVENPELVLKDERTRDVVKAVLTRFSGPELDSVDSAPELLRHVLASTLNGALDARDLLDNDLEWVEALLDAFARARDDAEVPDDFLLGLVQGRGYRSLVSALLREGASQLSRDEAKAYEDVVASMLEEAARHVAGERGGVEDFFRDHWADLARAGLSSLHEHGPALLADEKPILRETLVAVIGALAEESDRDFFGSDTVVAMAEAAVGAIAARPELLDDSAGPSWLRDVVGSLAGVVSDQGIRRMLGAQGLELLLRDVLDSLGENPELLIAKPGLGQELVGSVLRSVAAAEGRRPELLARAAVGGALEAIAENPALLDTPYAAVVSSISRDVAERVRELSLSSGMAAELLEAVTSVVATNPELFALAHEQLAGIVVSKVLEETQGDPNKLVTGQALVDLVRRALVIVSARGLDLIGDGSAAQLGERVAAVLHEGLGRASAELGRRMNRDAVPIALAGLVDQWSRGAVPTLAADDPGFQTLFAHLADEAMDQAA